MDMGTSFARSAFYDIRYHNSEGRLTLYSVLPDDVVGWRHILDYMIRNKMPTRAKVNLGY